MNLPNIALSAWIKLDKDVGGTQARIVCRQETDAGAESWGMEIFGHNYKGTGPGNMLVFHANDGASTRNIISSSRLEANRWYHVLGINDGDSLYLFIDGKRDTAIVGLGNVFENNNAPIQIGARIEPADSFYFPGNIDDIRLYDRALDTEEIKALFYGKGDVNFDGKIDSVDVQCVVDLVLETKIGITPAQLWAADMNDDGIFNVLDVQLLVNLITLGKCGEQLSIVRIVNSFGSPGSIVHVPIELDAQGNENAFGFSLEFDTTIVEYEEAALGQDATGAAFFLNDSLKDEGKIGFLLGLPAGQTFAAGTRELLTVSFLVKPDVSTDSTMITFGDQPIPREAADENAGTLSALWKPGMIRIFHGFEADVVPGPNGDGKVTIADWVKIGRLAARLDTITADGNEFQRADCAPRLDVKDSGLKLGNGAVKTSDWVQAGRYAAKLDTLTPAGGPLSPASAIAYIESADLADLGEFSERPEITIAQADCALKAHLKQGAIDTVSIKLNARGNENALGFSLSYNPDSLTFVNAYNASGISGATLIINSVDSANGRVGIAFALPFGKPFSAGIHDVIGAVFSIKAASSDSLAIEFGDEPIARELVDVNANTLPATWASCSITTPVKENRGAIPTLYMLSQNYPNPFNPETSISYAIPTAGQVEIVIYNVIGEKIQTLVNRYHAPGRYRISWNGRNEKGTIVPSGVYVYRMKAGAFVQQRKICFCGEK